MKKTKKRELSEATDRELKEFKERLESNWDPDSFGWAAALSAVKREISRRCIERNRAKDPAGSGL